MPRVARRSGRDLAVVVAVLAVASLGVLWASGPLENIIVPIAAALLVVVARRIDLSWEELGLGRQQLRAGALWGLAAAALVVAVVALAALLPWSRPAFLDERFRNGLGAALMLAFVEIPLRTVLAEELAFRGVLFAVLLRDYGTRAAVAGSSLLFGLWHVGSAWVLASDNDAVGSAVGAGLPGQLLSVLGAVVVTTAAGLVFCWLRLRSGSLLAPIGLHWALNSAAALAAAAVWALTE